MIQPDFFVSNRLQLSKSLNGGLIIVSANAEMQRTNDTSFKFEQEANFWWLCGVSAAKWLLIIEPDKSHLVMPEVDPTEALFNGSLAANKAQKLSGVDSVLSFSEYEQLLPELAKKYDTVHIIDKDPSSKWYEFTINPAMDKLRKDLKKVFKDAQDCRQELKKLRAIKQDVEVRSLQKAVDVTVGAFNEVKDKLTTFSHEYEIEAFFNSEFRRTGLSGHAYDPIVAGGKNACTLHYNTNNDDLPNDGLVLLDIGAKFNGYAADITRTYAVGTPTMRQSEVHSAVEAAHRKIIDLIKPDVKLEDYQNKVDEIMKDALQEVGLLSDRDDKKTYRKYFPHAVSHGLGIDVHESLGGFGVFKEGMILTVEPGIYIPKEGIGVRIEDDILVTAKGSKNLSASLSTAL